MSSPAHRRSAFSWRYRRQTSTRSARQCTATCCVVWAIPEEGDQIAVDHHRSHISEADKALLDFAVKLGSRPSQFGLEDVKLLRTSKPKPESVFSVVPAKKKNTRVKLLVFIATLRKWPMSLHRERRHFRLPGGLFIERVGRGLRSNTVAQ